MSRMSDIDIEFRTNWRPGPWFDQYDHVSGRYRLIQLPSGKVALYAIKGRWIFKRFDLTPEMFDSLAEAVYYVSQQEA